MRISYWCQLYCSLRYPTATSSFGCVLVGFMYNLTAFVDDILCLDVEKSKEDSQDLSICPGEAGERNLK